MGLDSQIENMGSNYFKQIRTGNTNTDLSIINQQKTYLHYVAEKIDSFYQVDTLLSMYTNNFTYSYLSDKLLYTNYLNKNINGNSTDYKGTTGLVLSLGASEYVNKKLAGRILLKTMFKAVDVYFSSETAGIDIDKVIRNDVNKINQSKIKYITNKVLFDIMFHKF